MESSKPKQKIPLLFTAVCGDELYLVNNLDYAIFKFTVSSGGFEQELTISSSEKSFLNLKPRSIVKIDEYDPYFDSDFYLQTVIEIIEIKNESLVSTFYKLPLKKGRFVSNVLIYSE